MYHWEPSLNINDYIRENSRFNMFSKYVKIYISAILVFCCSALYAQMDQHGTVVLYDSDKTPLAGVQVIAYGAPATDTDQNGSFVLRFPDKAPGMTACTDMYKKGYEIVNRDEVSRFILSQKSVMKAVMAPIGTVEAIKMKYYGIASENYSRRYSSVMQEINELYSAREITMEQRRSMLDSLNHESEIYWEKLNYYVERFARINPDDVEGVDRMALEAVRKGDLEGAVRIYEDARIVEQALAKIDAREGLETDVQALAQSLQRYSDLCAIAGGWEYRKKSVEIKMKIAELFPEDFYKVRDYVYSLSIYDEGALKWYDRLIEIASDEFDLSDAVHGKGDFCRRLGRYEEAMKLYLSSIEISGEYDDFLPATYARLQAFSSVVLLMYTLGQYENVIETGHDIMEILDDLDIEEFDVLRLAVTNNMVDAYFSMKEWVKFGELLRSRYDLMKRMEAYGFVDMEGMDAEYMLTAGNMRLATAKGDLQAMYEYNEQLLKILEPLFRNDPESFVSAYVSTLEVKYQNDINKNPAKALQILEEYEQKVRNEMLPHLSEVGRSKVMYDVEYLYVWYYQKQSMFAESYPHVISMNEYADVLEEKALYENIFAVITSRSKYLEMLIRLQDDALQEFTLELESLYRYVKEAHGFSDTTAESDIAVGYYMSGEYEMALEYFDVVRKERESVLREFPDNFEVEANLSSTYSNIAGCLSGLGRDAEALSAIEKAIDIISGLYALRPTSYGPNYFQYLGNAVTLAYWSGNRRQAEKYIDALADLGDDLASRGNAFMSLPYAARLVKHDYLQAIGRRVNDSDYDAVLQYVPGTLQNDWILVNLIRWREANGSLMKR